MDDRRVDSRCVMRAKAGKTFSGIEDVTMVWRAGGTKTADQWQKAWAYVTPRSESARPWGLEQQVFVVNEQLLTTRGNTE